MLGPILLPVFLKVYPRLSRDLPTKVSSCRSWARQALALATRRLNGATTRRRAANFTAGPEDGKNRENYEKKHGKLWKLWENYGDNYGKLMGNYGTSHVLMRIAGFFSSVNHSRSTGTPQMLMVDQMFIMMFS